MSYTANHPAVQVAENWQREFPLVQNPFALIAQQSAMNEQQVLNHLISLHESGVLSRIGVAIRPNTIGVSTLAALAAPDERLEEIAAIITADEGVNHNYQRTHELNIWFVLVAANEDELQHRLNSLSERTGCRIFDLRLLEAFHIDLGFRLDGSRTENGMAQSSPQATGPYKVSDDDQQIIEALGDGLDFVPNPYQALASRIGITEQQVIDSIKKLSGAGIISRFGCILRHRALGMTANAMVVWQVADDVVSQIGRQLSTQQGVTLCYRRRSYGPDWPYNLFAMFHGHERHLVEQKIAHATQAAGLEKMPRQILFSTRCFKQCGARYRAMPLEAAQ